MLTHYNIVANICQMRPFDFSLMSPDRDVQLAVLPFFHVYVSRITVRKCEVSASNIGDRASR
jgi:long-subunit acyl-CoA synthetase (AMP-forming)